MGIFGRLRVNVSNCPCVAPRHRHRRYAALLHHVNWAVHHPHGSTEVADAIGDGVARTFGHCDRRHSPKRTPHRWVDASHVEGIHRPATVWPLARRGIGATCSLVCLSNAENHHWHVSQSA